MRADPKTYGLRPRLWLLTVAKKCLKCNKPPIFFPLMKSTSLPYYFSEKVISIDKIPAILQAFKVVISCPTTEHSGIWVGLLVTSSKDIAQNTKETFG